VNENNYMPCGECSKQMGAYNLCESCLHNRTVIDHLKAKIENRKRFIKAAGETLRDLSGMFEQ